MNLDSSRDQGVSPQLVCSHCGLVFHPSHAQVTIWQSDSSRPLFCCVGCETVFGILNDAGLGEYYKIKSNGACIRAPLPALQAKEEYDYWDTTVTAGAELLIYVEGVHCTACIWLLEKLPHLYPQLVQTARLDLGQSLLALTLVEGVRPSQVAPILSNWGYRPHLVANPKSALDLRAKENRQQVLDVGIAGALAGNIMLVSLPIYAGVEGDLLRLFEWASAVLCLPVMFYSARGLLANVVVAFRQRRFSIDIPIVLAIMAAFFWSWRNLLVGSSDLYFDSLSGLVFLLLASRYLLTRMRQVGLEGRTSFELLLKRSTQGVGEVIKAGLDETLAIDGVIRKGSGFLDRSFLTGESGAVPVGPGDMVLAGSQIVGLQTGVESLSVEVTSSGDQTRIFQILKRINGLQSQRSSIEKSDDRLAQGLMATVTVIGLVAFAWFAWQDSMATAISRTLTLFIVTCPCALALATPLNLSFALRRAFRLGLVVKDVDVFERMKRVRRIDFDKTGTLTDSRLSVLNIGVAKEFWPVLRSLVWPSRHPVSRALAAELEGQQGVEVERWQELPGLGVEAFFQGQRYELKRQILPSCELQTQAQFICEGRSLGVVTLESQLRPDAREVIQTLKSQGFVVGLLSGDRPEMALHVAAQLGIDKKEVHGGLMPEEKADWIEKYSEQFGQNVFVGDGLNDILAISRASVGIAVNGGLESALQGSSVYLLRSQLKSLVHLVELSRKVVRLHYINFGYSTSYNLVAGTIALTGYMTPLWAAVIMPLSAATVFWCTYLHHRQADQRQADQRWG
jgi:P-type E1-E2 ATPase